MFILDHDPILAANYLTKSHIKYYNLLAQTVFRKTHNTDELRKGIYLALCKYIETSTENYKWFVTFYRQLRENYKTYVSKSNEYHSYIDGFSEDLLTPTADVAEGPFYPFIPTNFKKYLQNMERSKNELPLPKDLIALHRSRYIEEGYLPDEFINGYPDWYLNQGEAKIVYRSYSYKDNKRVKIELDCINGYRFFFASQSDNWLEIESVPDEMRYIVNSFILPMSKPRKKGNKTGNNSPLPRKKRFY